MKWSLGRRTKMAKILIVVGSPIKNGNADMLADAFKEGAEKNNNIVTKIDLADKKIAGCIGCQKCIKSPGSCVQKDDMESIRTIFEDSDIIVFATPLYYWSFSAQMKAFLDRLFASHCYKGPNCPHKKCALIVAAGNKDPDIFTPIVTLYTYGYINRLGWEDMGMVLAGGLSEKGAAKNSKFLDQARALGESIK